MGAPGLTSPIRREGLQHLQLNAGVFLTNFPADRLFSADGVRAEVKYRLGHNEGVLGMTRGGGTFTLGREPRTPDVDGRRYLHVGAQFVDSMDASITGTLIEIVPAAWQAVIGTTEPLESNTATRAAYRVKTMIGDGAYLENLCWVGDVADGGMCVIVFDNALNTADVAFTFQDKNEGTLPFELHAHQGNVLTYDTAPARVLFFEEGLFYKRSLRTVGGSSGFQQINLPPNTFNGTYTLTFYAAAAMDQLKNIGSNDKGILCGVNEILEDSMDVVPLSACIGDDVFQIPVQIGESDTFIAFNGQGTVTKYSGSGSAVTYAFSYTPKYITITE